MVLDDRKQSYLMDAPPVKMASISVSVAGTDVCVNLLGARRKSRPLPPVPLDDCDAEVLCSLRRKSGKALTMSEGAAGCGAGDV